jgi:hypothetical protein
VRVHDLVPVHVVRFQDLRSGFVPSDVYGFRFPFSSYS